MAAYYNEHDPYAAEWLRNLIAEGLIADGDVDERDIWDVYPSDVRGYTQCHFFAGLGGWSAALRLAGVPDDRPVWTGSAPCQPFSAAGKGLSFADERHLWPAFFHLIEQCRPGIVMGEQVASKDGLAWLDLVSDDLQGAGYASRAVDTCAASVGAPHIRQRLYWVADSAGFRRQRLHTVTGCDGKGDGRSRDRGEKRRASVESQGACDVVRLANGNSKRRGERTQRNGESEQPGIEASRGGDSGGCGGLCGLADAGCIKSEQPARAGAIPGEAEGGRTCRGPTGCDSLSGTRPAGPTNGFWSDADWLYCRDGKWRPVPKAQSGILLLADGFWYRVDDVLSELYTQAMREVSVYAKESGTNASEVLRAVRERISAETVRSDKKPSVGPAGGFERLQQEEVLLNPLWDALAAREQPSFDDSREQKKNENSQYRMLRDLRVEIETVCASLRRKSNEQQPGEPTDTLLELSQFLSRCCEAGRDFSSRANAANFPLSGQVKGRAAMLKGAGNAIVPQVAAEFIRAVML